MTSGDSRPAAQPLRTKSQAREALAEFAETASAASSSAESAFGPAEGAHGRAEARKVSLAHFAAHVLLLALVLAALGSGLAYFALLPWISGTAGTAWDRTLSSRGVLFLVAGSAALVTVALWVTAVYFLSKLAAPSRERQRFLSALPRGLRRVRPRFLLAAWLVLAAAFVAWSLGGL